jgi:EAL domain-containing protein (putative c-di-GMP-specific phosphodiesterase class I)/FixJ family two-component response regulator
MILFVDDDPNLLAGLWRNLSMTYEMDTAISGADALELMKRKGPYTVIVSDIKMPEMDGVEFLAKAHELSPDSVKIALSGWAGKDHVIDAVNHGHIFRFLTKPVQLDQMREVLDTAIQHYLDGRQTENLTAEKFVKWSRALNEAIAKDQLFLVYQPQIDLTTNAMCGVETLVRWRHPQHGLVMPSEFIATAELTGAIVPLTKWVMKNACEQMKNLAGEHDPFVVSFNISPAHLDKMCLEDTAREILQQTGFAPDLIEYEVTETVVVENLSVFSKILGNLSNMGGHIALDDFGSGYMNFSYLRDLPVDKLKIDGSYIRHILTDDKCAAIVQSMVAIGRSMGLTVVAEYIENEDQAKFLQKIGCDLGQGYFFSQPLEAEDLADWIGNRAKGIK